MTMNIYKAWHKGYTGKNVTICIHDPAGVEKSNVELASRFVSISLLHYALVIGLPRKGDPGTTGGRSAKIEEECTPVSGLFSCPRIGGHFQVPVGGCHCLC